jgi:hypothetical protein
VAGSQVGQKLKPVPLVYGTAGYWAAVASSSPHTQRLWGHGGASWGRQAYVAGARRRMRTAGTGQGHGSPGDVRQSGRGHGSGCEGDCRAARRRQAGHCGIAVVAQVRGQAVASHVIVASSCQHHGAREGSGVRVTGAVEVVEEVAAACAHPSTARQGAGS